jgi:hypothetical protein
MTDLLPDCSVVASLIVVLYKARKVAIRAGETVDDTSEQFNLRACADQRC